MTRQREFIAMGRRVLVEEDPDTIGVRFREGTEETRREEILDEGAERGSGRGAEIVAELREARATLLRLAVPSEEGDRGPEERGLARDASLRALGLHEDIERVLPVFRVPGGRAMPTERVLVGFQGAPSKRIRALKKRGVEVEAGRGPVGAVSLRPDEDAFDVAERLRGLPGVAWAEPEFLLLRQSVVPKDLDDEDRGDRLLPRQYAPGLVRAAEAWRLQQGDPAIRVAILDEGVDTRHEDLHDAVAATWDALDRDGDQEPEAWDGHGTACAGLAVGVSNDRGIRGIAAGCSLVAVRVARSDKPGGLWSTTTAALGDAIDWAWKEGGADVLSNSWACGLPSSVVGEAVERARTLGRGGKGCVVVAAAGNDDGPVAFPASMEGVLCVAASNEYDEPKTPRSRDGETWWGSNHGVGVDLAAPGVHNVTTDIMGAGGYSAGGSLGPHYTATFNGTSSSTPIVAGAAALMLSARPDLREAEVREILRRTADKVGGVEYADGWNERMGHGRLNVLAALEALTRPQSVEGLVLRPEISGVPFNLYFLRTDEGRFLLLDPGSSPMVAELADPSADPFLPFVKRRVRADFTREELLHGQSRLLGVRLVDLQDSPRGGGGAG
jgi:subtilisin family serine protease